MQRRHGATLLFRIDCDTLLFRSRHGEYVVRRTATGWTVFTFCEEVR